ncbi:MAG: lipopolysaccharide biosynthesis protein [Armatimonadota bacterium]|nr:lipopolysaccharide biosynthesis protein [Armatimonadota bacterium]
MSLQEADHSAAFWQTGTFWRRVGIAVPGLWASVALGFATTLVLARSLGPQGFGALALATSVVATVAVLLDVPLEEAVVHHGSRALVAGAPGTLYGILRRSLVADAVTGVSVASLVLALAEPVAYLTSGGWLDPQLVRLAALTTMVQTVDGTTGAALLLAGRPHTRAWLMAASGALRLTLVGSTAFATQSPRWTLFAALVAAVAGSTLQGWAAWRAGGREWRRDRVRADVEVGIGPLLSFGLRSALATTVSGARNGLIPVVLGRLSGPAAVAVFEVATFPLQAADVAGAPVRLALFPEQARLAAEGRHRELPDSSRAYVRAGLVIGVPAAIAGWFLLPWLIPTLYSARYADAVTPARIFLLAAIGSLAFGWTKTLPAALGRPDVRVVVLALDAVVVLSLLVIFAPRGAVGGAIAVTAGLLTQAVVWTVLLRRAAWRHSPYPAPAIHPRQVLRSRKASEP